MANINISVPDDVHKNLKVAAVIKQTSLKTLIIETLEQYTLASSSQKKKLGVRK